MLKTLFDSMAMGKAKKKKKENHQEGVINGISNYFQFVALSLRPKTHDWYEFKVCKKIIIQIFAWENVF